MARRTKADWDALLAEYAQAFQETKIKAQDWYESVVNDGSWGSAKRHITAKKAKEFLAGDTDKSQPAKTANNRTSTANNRKSSNQSANNRKSKTDREKGADHKSLNSKDKSSKKSTNSNNKDQVKRESVGIKSQAKSATPKQPHGALSQEGADNYDFEDEKALFADGNMCGARTRFGHRCKKQSGWGTDHFGEGRCRLHGGLNSGAPARNTNATVHGIYSLYLDDDEQEFFNSQSAAEMDLTPEIARVRVELKRCYERAAVQRDLVGGASGYFDSLKATAIKELDSHDVGQIGDGPMDIEKKVVRDYGAIADRLMGRLLQLMRQQTQLASFTPKEETAELLDFYLSEYEASAMTAKDVALSLSRFSIKVPSVIEIALRAEIEMEGVGDAEGLSDAELDALVEQERAEAQAHFDKNMEGREELIEKMIAGEEIDLEGIEHGG